MLYCKNSKIIFIHIPKTAGTTISSVIRKSLRDQTCITGGKNTEWNYHTSALEFKNKVHNFNDYFKFTFVRNPYDRLYSWCSMLFQKSFKQGVTKEKFKHWLLKGNTSFSNNRLQERPQLYWINDENGNSLIDFIGKFENLQHDFNKLCDILNIKISTLPTMRTSIRSKNYSDFYDHEMIGFVKHYHKKDLEEFNYSL